MIDNLAILYTGEPRSLKKGLVKRNKLFQKNKTIINHIETRYLLCYLKDPNKKLKNQTLNNLKYLKKDNYLKLVNIQERVTDNIYNHILKQKRDVLSSYLKSKPKENTIIILTRTDWLFTNETLRLVFLSKEKNFIISPGIAFNKKEKKGLTYYSFNDHFMVIPLNLLQEVIKSFNYAIKEIDKVKPNIKKSTSEVHSGNGEKRFGSGPEDALGYGFAKNNLKEKHLVEQIAFSYAPSMLDTISHNLIRDDALRWMRFSPKQVLFLYFVYIKPIILGKIKHILLKGK